MQEFPKMSWNPELYYRVKKLSTGPYHELDQSSPYHLIPFL
jgi:hypothetical protein